jgi:hypothetical protein
LEGLDLADERRKEQSFVTVIEICVGSCYGTYLADVYTSSEGELFTVLKDGSIRKTIVHICDISNYKTEWNLLVHLNKT